MLHCEKLEPASAAAKCLRLGRRFGAFHPLAHTPYSAFMLTFFPQIFAFIACACLQAAAFVKWKRSQSQNQREWKFYGWFTALAFIGCVNGALAYGMRMQKLALAYKSEAILCFPQATFVTFFQGQRAERTGCTDLGRETTSASFECRIPVFFNCGVHFLSV